MGNRFKKLALLGSDEESGRFQYSMACCPLEATSKVHAVDILQPRFSNRPRKQLLFGSVQNPKY